MRIVREARRDERAILTIISIIDMGSAQLSAVQITRILNDWSGGDRSALERLTPVVYAELRRLAGRNLGRGKEDHLLQPSALINEAFVRLIGSEPVAWASRAHFFAHSACLMRRILIDFARAQHAAKRHFDGPRADLSNLGDLGATQPTPVDFLDLDAALEELAVLDARQERVVELRYFGGLDNAEIAAVLDVSEPTVIRDWRMARAWLFKRLQPRKAQ
ncbi:MAG: ECF-type sigma factor [Bryobacteraceae bacterium]